MDSVQMPIKMAETICEMETVCLDNGVGPDTRELMRWILKTYPELEDIYSYALSGLGD